MHQAGVGRSLDQPMLYTRSFLPSQVPLSAICKYKPFAKVLALPPADSNSIT